MKVVIPVAGEEKRLHPLTKEMHQCLFKLNGKTVIETLLDNLENNKIEEAILIVGHKSEKIIDLIKDNYKKMRIKFIHNKDYAKTNVIYSLWLTKNEVKGKDFLLIDGDIILEQELLNKLLMCEEANALLIDSNKKIEDKAMKVKIVNDEVVQIGKQIKILDDGNYGVSIGAYKFGSDLSENLFDEIEELINQGKVNLFYEDGLNNLLDTYKLKTINVRGFHWIEIDNIDQFDKAKKLFGDIINLKNKAMELGTEFAFIILPQDIIFDQRARLMCFYCEHYGNKRTCPPDIPDLNYEDMIKSYRVGLIMGVKMKYAKETFPRVRRESTNKLHSLLLHLEKESFNLQNHYSISFIGGSCKLCKEGCAPKCKHPELARIPVEAIGVDVVETLNKFGIKLAFPIKEYLYRIGLLMIG